MPHRDAPKPPHDLTPDELEGMLDAMSSLLFPGDRDAARLTMQLPVVSVISNLDGWRVQALHCDGSEVIDTFTHRAAAVRIARAHARAAGGTLVLHGVSGRVQQTYHYDSVDDEGSVGVSGEVVHLFAGRKPVI